MTDPRHGVRPSLWLLPDEAPQLTPVLARLAEAHGGPSFAPHLTLLGSIPGSDLSARTARLAAQLSPMVVPAGAVTDSDRWFRCLTLAVQPTPALLAARQAAERAFVPDPRPWAPHISLLYGHLTAAERDTAAAGLPSLPASVRLSVLALVDTIGPAEQWVERARFTLR